MRQRLKTFLEMRTERPDLYPETIPEELQATINNWFDVRRVCDNANFPRFFRRVLSRDYETYRQLLRIEPGISQYDWLVQTYHELMNEAQDTRATMGEASGTSKETAAESSSRGAMSTDAKQYEDEKARKDSKSRADLSEIETQKSGQETDAAMSEKSGEDSRRDTKASEGVKASERKADSTAAQYGHGTTSEDGSTGTTGATSGTGETLTNEAALSKQAPMSIVYTPGSGGGFHDSPTGADGMPALDWQTASAQEQRGGKSDTSDNETRAEQSITHGSGLSDQSDSGATLSKEEESGTERETSAGLSEGKSAEEAKDTRAKLRQDDGQEKHNSTGAELSEGSDSGKGAQTAARQTSEEGGATRATEGERGEKRSETSAGNRVLKERLTGRTVDIATLLSNAASFIQKSEAWEWLYSRLDVCFMGVYDEDEEEGVIYEW